MTEGESPFWNPVGGNQEPEATARDQRLTLDAIRSDGPLCGDDLSREGVWDGSPRLTAAPNASEAS
jgi:hypothetical protein